MLTFEVMLLILGFSLNSDPNLAKRRSGSTGGGSWGITPAPQQLTHWTLREPFEATPLIDPPLGDIYSAFRLDDFTA